MGELVLLSKKEEMKMNPCVEHKQRIFRTEELLQNFVTVLMMG